MSRPGLSNCRGKPSSLRKFLAANIPDGESFVPRASWLHHYIELDHPRESQTRSTIWRLGQAGSCSAELDCCLGQSSEKNSACKATLSAEARLELPASGDPDPNPTAPAEWKTSRSAPCLPSFLPFISKTSAPTILLLVSARGNLANMSLERCQDARNALVDQICQTKFENDCSTATTSNS